MHSGKSNITTRPLEQFFAILSAIACLIVTIAIWRSISSYQAMWPLPGIYLLELVALSILSAFAFYRGIPYQGFIIWGTVGVFIAFSIMGASSIGSFYLPVALIFAIIAITWIVRNKQPILSYVGVCLGAGLIQAILMVAAIRLLYPTAAF